MAAKSQNGWNVIEHRESNLLHSWQIPGVGFFEPLYRRGPAGLVLAHWTMFFHEEIERLDAGAVGDDFGWSPRPIEGTNEWSNHASATAGDLNSLRHPKGSDPLHSFTPVQLDRMRKVLKSQYQGALRHGAFYRGTPDPMHHEIDQAPAEIRVQAKRLADTKRGEALLNANPGQRRFILN